MAQCVQRRSSRILLFFFCPETCPFTKFIRNFLSNAALADKPIQKRNFLSRGNSHNGCNVVLLRFMEPSIIVVLGGILPFGSIFIEMYACHDVSLTALHVSLNIYIMCSSSRDLNCSFLLNYRLIISSKPYFVTVSA